jgi:hypothetical protein
MAVKSSTSADQDVSARRVDPADDQPAAHLVVRRLAAKGGPTRKAPPERGLSCERGTSLSPVALHLRLSIGLVRFTCTCWFGAAGDD